MSLITPLIKSSLSLESKYHVKQGRQSTFISNAFLLFSKTIWKTSVFFFLILYFTIGRTTFQIGLKIVTKPTCGVFLKFDVLRPENAISNLILHRFFDFYIRRVKNRFKGNGAPVLILYWQDYLEELLSKSTRGHIQV